MKKIFNTIAIVILAFVLFCSVFACQNLVERQPVPPESTQENSENSNQDNNNLDSEGETQNDKTPASQQIYETVLGLGLEADFETFQSIISQDLAFALPSKNGAISIQERDDSPYAHYYGRHNKYIFEARPDQGYYFEGWEAYDYAGMPLDAKEQRFGSNDQLEYVFCNVMGDYKSSNSAIRYVRAIFTDDEQKMVDTAAVPYEHKGDDSGLYNSFLPDKIVRGTRISQLIRPRKNYYITEWSTFYAVQDGGIIGGNIVAGSIFNGEYKGLRIEYDENGIITSNSNTFGVPSKFFVKTRSIDEVALVYVHVSYLQPYMTSGSGFDGSQGFYFQDPHNHANPYIVFVDKNKPLYLEPRGQYSGDAFYGWYDWDGNLLTKNYVYIDTDFDDEVLHLSMRIANFGQNNYTGFTEHTDYLRFNPIDNDTAWEVIYNYENTEFIDVLTIPEFYKGKPVTRIADRGFAKFWLRRENEPYQWYFDQAHPQIGRLVIPASIREVGDYAFATVHRNVSFSTLTAIYEDTDGDGWTDTQTNITYEVEFQSINTRVTPYTFSQSGHKFINAWGQMEQVLNTLLHTYVNGVYALKLEVSQSLQSDGMYQLSTPYTIHLSSQIMEQGDGKMYFAMLHEFRHFMQHVSSGAISGATLKQNLGELYNNTLAQNFESYIPSSENGYSDQFIEQDANIFAYAYFGYMLNYANLLIYA